MGVALFTACATIEPPGLGRPVSFSELPGWNADRHAEGWPALLRSCEKLGARDAAMCRTHECREGQGWPGAAWRRLCDEARALPAPSDDQARAFFEGRFVPRPVVGENGRREGLITGYYEPLLHGSPHREGAFVHPLYRPPDDLLTVDLAELYPELRGKTVRGRIEGRRVVPYPDRRRIDSAQSPLAGNELLWVDDPVALFFLHIQGSGRVRLSDGAELGVGYADQNGHPYRAIGRTLIESGELKAEDVNLFTLRDWLRRNPARAADVLNSNPSYVFFTSRGQADSAPMGAFGVPLTPGRSIAVDRAAIPLGSPVWLDTQQPDESGQTLRHLVFAQDTGGAIKGLVRADLFWGHGPDAERRAGLMKHPGRMYVLMPK
jgi:membrane-bound lytic murein transglycosylase A